MHSLHMPVHVGSCPSDCLVVIQTTCGAIRCHSQWSLCARIDASHFLNEPSTHKRSSLLVRCMPLELATIRIRESRRSSQLIRRYATLNYSFIHSPMAKPRQTLQEPYSNHNKTLGSGSRFSSQVNRCMVHTKILSSQSTSQQSSFVHNCATCMI